MVPVLLLIANAWQSGATDSLGVLKSARRAQATFEATRRANLPERPGGWSGGSSQIIGRIRVWYESGVDDETPPAEPSRIRQRSEEHTSELQSPCNLVCRLLLEKKKNLSTRSTPCGGRIPIGPPVGADDDEC